MTRQLILVASAIVLALNIQSAEASMARIICHCKGGDIQGECLPRLRMLVTVRGARMHIWLFFGEIRQVTVVSYRRCLFECYCWCSADLEGQTAAQPSSAVQSVVCHER